jgi:hypothetical protein
LNIYELKRAIIKTSNQIDQIIELIEETDIDDEHELQKRINMLIKLQTFQLWHLEKLEQSRIDFINRS